ncbi:ABC transporter substrate-binding protein [Rhizorhabdus dicambivorans]|uniref:ABC transporter substrate-binding protein n=1 Tax=Rhizorhabdus dicambivorans TaxID=1850238 RepID=A0A2A4FWU6_9SPHN|nr:ABC transporter substrate-binding protein [Rhizorhabdus dicambivorans]ATE66963.1 ABC transporter substrate-binding protein [Rhizorhabdus dicambivorans]PCE42164.1 ABC transporter substrate-binding protein [Rhizorhabdus dicambivorans]
MKRLLAITLCLTLPLAGCGRGDREGQVSVSVIGRETKLRDPAGGTPRQADAALLGATAQGLVRLNAGAQIEPGLAIRWAISDDGLYYTFRLDHELADADRVVAQLRRLLRRQAAANPAAGLEAVREIIAVTPEVIELRLSAPRPELLALLAGPGFTLPIRGQGSGPLLIEGKVGRVTVLRPKPVAMLADDDKGRALAERRIRLRGERAALAVARFRQGELSLVTGGGYNDFIYARVADLPPRVIQIDPANGLFGFRVGRTSSPAMAPEIRQALSMALDRAALGAALGVPGWRPAQAILPPGLTDLAEPSRPFWAQAFANVRGSDQQAFLRRVATARRIVSIWQSQQPGSGPVRIEVAMPDGPGSTMIFAHVRRQWRAIGVDAVRVRATDGADLRLIDEVAPADQADWYLSWFLCARGRPCSEEADKAFGIARAATDPALRARMIAEAEQRLAAIAPFIPIAQPVRWSLARPDLPGFRLNPRAVHPLPPLIGNQNGR